MPRPRSVGVRLVLVGALLAGAFYAGTTFFTHQGVAIQPLTGRVIAGLATSIAWLERDEREREEDPERTLTLIGIESGQVVADVGAGSGYLTVRLAARVGRTGAVYANELQPAMLEAIDRKVRQGGLSNVTLVPGTETDTRLPPNAIDVVLLVDVYHELRYPQQILRSIRRSLADDGVLAVVEYRKEDPSIPIADTHRMSVAELRTEIEAEGFRLDRRIDELPRQHILTFRRVVEPPR